jgi:hypothetical protein
MDAKKRDAGILADLRLCEGGIMKLAVTRVGVATVQRIKAALAC